MLTALLLALFLAAVFLAAVFAVTEVGLWLVSDPEKQPEPIPLEDEPLTPQPRPSPPVEPEVYPEPLPAAAHVGRPGLLLTLAGLLLGTVIWPALALAQGMPDAGAVMPQPSADPVVLLQQMLALFADYKSVGLVGTLLACTNLLVNLTKVQALDGLLGSRPWLRPAIAVVTGILLASLGAAASGASIPAAVLVGIMAGLGSTGLHELITSLNGAKQGERSAGAALAEAVKVGDQSVATKIEAMKAQLDVVGKIPDEAGRLKALADLGSAS